MVTFKPVAGTTTTDSSPHAIVLGSGVTVLGVSRCLGLAGIRVHQIDSAPSFERWSRWYHRLGADGETVSEQTGLSEFLAGLDLNRAVLIPCSDNWSAVIAGLPQDLKIRFPSSVLGPEAQRAIVDKASLAELLTKTGVPHPLTRDLTDEKDLEDCDDAIFVDAFLKPRNSQKFFAQFGVKACRVASRDEARETLQRMQNDGHQMVIQQYIPGPSSNHYFVDGFVDKSGRICGMWARRRLRMYPEDFGNSSYQVSVALDDVKGCPESLERIFAEIGFRGLFSTEFKFDDRDSEFKLLEINARPWWYIWFPEICGMPLARMAYDDALGRSVEAVRSYNTGVYLLYPSYDFDACMSLYRKGEISLWAWARSWWIARQAIFTWHDPMPSIFEFLAHVKRAFSTRLARLWN